MDGLEDNLEGSDGNSIASNVETVVEEQDVLHVDKTRRIFEGIEFAVNLFLSPLLYTRVHGTYETMSRGFGAVKYYLTAKKSQYTSAYAEFKESATYSTKLIKHKLMRFINISEGYFSKEAEERDKGIAHFKGAVRFLSRKGYKVRFILPPTDGQVGRFFYNREDVGCFIWGELGRCINLSNDAHWRLVHPLEELGYTVSRQPKLQ